MLAGQTKFDGKDKASDFLLLRAKILHSKSASFLTAASVFYGWRG